MSAPTTHAHGGTVATTAVPPMDVAAAGVVSSNITGVAPVSGQEDSVAQGSVCPTGYEHLAALFAERAALPEGHPRRERLRGELIAGYLPVARHIARRYRHRGEPPQDLEQVASMGLILAVDRFDPGRGIDFLSFAVPTITGVVLRHFRDRVHTIRVPRRLRELQSRICDAAGELAQRHGRAARPSEIARHLGVDVEIVLEGLAAHGAGHTWSLDEPAGHDDGGAGSGDRARFAAAAGSSRSSTWSSTGRASRRCSRCCPSGSDGSCCCGSSAGSPRPRSPPRSGFPRCTSRACSPAP
jgi:RNA polymerase sigma-B factor